MTADSEILAIPQSWSRAEVCKALAISPEEIKRLIAAGKVGYYRAGRQKRFFAEHIGQIRAALEVKPVTDIDPDIYARIGVTRQAARRRRNSA